MLLRAIVSRWRGDGQDAIVFRNVTSSLLARAVTVLSTLVAIPLVLNAFGAERYAIWIISLTLGSLFTLADFGVVNAMLSMISRAYGASDLGLMRRLLSSTLVLAISSSLLLLLGLIAAIWFFDVGSLVGVDSPELSSEAETVILFTGIGFAIQFPLAAVRHARLGMLQGVPVNLWDLAGALLGVCGLIAAVLLDANLIVAVALWALLPSVPKAISAFQYFASTGHQLLPSFDAVDRKTAKMLLGSGAIFTLSGISQFLALQSDQILISHILGLEQVAPYSIVQRLFSQPQIFVTLLVAAQWPVYGEALGRGDGDWIIRHFTKSIFGIIGFAVSCALVMALLCDSILTLWIGRSLSPSFALIVGMAAYCVVSCTSAALISFYLALGLNKQVIVMQIAMFVVTLPLSIYLLPRIGSAGAIYGTSTGYLLCVLIPGILLLKRTFRAFPRLHQKGDTASSPSKFGS